MPTDADEGTDLSEFSRAEPEQAARESGARCPACGHYETRLRRAVELYAHCPSCNAETSGGAHWIEVPNESREGLSAEVIRTLRHCVRVATLAGDLSADERYRARDALDAAEMNREKPEQAAKERLIEAAWNVACGTRESHSPKFRLVHAHKIDALTAALEAAERKH